MTAQQNVVTLTATNSVLVAMAERFGMQPAAFEATLRATVCKGNVSREEFAAFLLVAKEYGLNPVTKELYAFPAKGGGIQPIVSIDGWSRIINDHPMFDGMEFEDVREGDDLVAITCRMHRKDRSRSIEATEYMAECRRATDVWKTWPRRMLRHKAMIQCARYAFGFSGIVDPDEYERQMTVTQVATGQTSGLAARLAAPSSDTPTEGFNAVSGELLDGDQIPAFDTPPDVSEQPVSDDAEQPSQAGASEAGDDFPGDQEGQAEERPDPMIDRANRTIADIAFKSLAELKTTKEDGRFKAFVDALRVQHPAKADEVEKALKDALESFG